MAQNIGVIGLGMMGRHYLQRLRQAGYGVHALDVNAERLRWAQDSGLRR
jgi:3-hydroxyisobutyrate dehydrogenase-like beta-hydroxyacid dehydrogenase